MTLIATWKYRNLPLFLGDILVTSDVKQDVDIPIVRAVDVDIPLVQGINEMLRGKATFTVNESKQKLCIMRDNLVTAWSGSYIQAHEVLSKLDQKFEGVRITKEALIDFCENLDPRRFDNVDLIFGVLNVRKQGDRIHSDVYRCSSFIKGVSFNHPIYDWVAVAGSGQKAFLDVLGKSEIIFSKTGNDVGIADIDDKNIFNAYQQALGLLSSFAGMECVSGGINIIDRWGGGYEIAFPVDRFYKMRDILHSFWFLKNNGQNDFSLHLFNKLYKIAYHEDLLIYYILDNFLVKPPTITFDTNLLLVPPILKRVDDYDFSDASKIFNFEHKYLATTLWDLSEGKINDVFFKVDALPSEKSNIVIIIEGKKIGLAFKQQYLEELVELCGKHFKKNVKKIVLG